MRAPHRPTGPGSAARPVIRLTCWLRGARGGVLRVLLSSGVLNLACQTSNPDPDLGTVVQSATAGVYQLQAVHSGKCLEVVNAELGNGWNVQQVSCGAGAEQRWELVARPDGSFRIRPQHSAKCLVALGKPGTPGDNVQQGACRYKRSKWRVLDVAAGEVALQSVKSDLCAAVAGASLADGANLVQATCDTGDSQRFRLAPTFPAIDLGSAPIHIEAECAHGPDVGDCGGRHAGSFLGTQLENGDTTVGYFDDGAYLAYTGIDFSGRDVLQFRYANETAGGTVQVRLDSATGTLIGEYAPPDTGGWTSWQQGGIALAATTGTHDLYLVAAGATGIMSFDWLELSSYPAPLALDTSVNPAVSQVLHINQIGYDSAGAKLAVVESSGGLSSFQIVPSGASFAVLEGTLALAPGFSAWGGGPNFYVADFTALTQPGTYTLYVNGEHSRVFEVDDQLLFDRTVNAVLGYFTNSRADQASVWAADAAVPFYGLTATRDVRGGWYDASGDISKYLSHLSYANYLNPQQIPLVAWALAWVHDQAPDLLTSRGLDGAVRDEALWGADYLVRVLDGAGYFYINVFDGWSGDLTERRICAFEGSTGVMTSDWRAAFREGGGVSIAALARISTWGVGGSYTPAQYLQAAEAGFAHLQANGPAYADDGVENVIDDYTALLAASELYLATRSDSYLSAARARATSLIARLHPTGYFIADGGSRPFWHASDAGLPVLALARYVEVETDSASLTAATDAITTHLTYLRAVTDSVANPYGYARQHFNSGGSLQSGFFIPHDNESNYWWQGESARLASLAAAALIGGRKVSAAQSGVLAVPAELSSFATRQLDWILGSNPFDACMMDGFGTNNPFEYCDPLDCQWKYGHQTLVGGISNGITGLGTNGSGIRWPVAAAEFGTEWWESWRWVEQWLPHAAWYLMASTALAQRP